MSDQDRKTRVKGNRVIHTVKGKINATGLAEGPRGLTNEQAEERRTGAKLDERQGRQYGEGGQDVKPGIGRLKGTDDVSGVKKGR